jgi:hypothetical protein
VAKALDGFLPTLESFCSVVLSNGHRTGNEWVVSDLANSGDGGSCHINLEKGIYHDFKTSESGHALSLFGEIFGLTELVDVVAGIEAWIKDGTLPDGSKGVPVPGVLKTETGEVLTARDAEEKEAIRWIQVYQTWIDHYRNLKDWHAQFPPRANVWLTGPSKPGAQPSRYGAYRETEIDWDAYVKDKVAHCETLIAGTKSKLLSRRWVAAVEETIRDRELWSKWLAELRGLSPDVFAWLIDNGYIAIYQRDVTSKTGNKFESHDVAFPIYRSVNWTAWPIESDIEFLGVQSKWIETGADDKLTLSKQWLHHPKGIRSEPWIIGDLVTADYILIGESNWDVIAAIDLLDAYRDEKTLWAAIATRGASNARRIPVGRIKPDATLIGLMQNDKGNEIWNSNLPTEIHNRLRL